MSASEIYKLSADLGRASVGVARALYTVYAESGDAFAEDWSSNARETSGEHGKYYPDSITSETRVSSSIVVETGPDSGRKQGRMGRGFEFGSVNQPPHFDGLRAMGPAEQRLAKAADVTIGFLLR